MRTLKSEEIKEIVDYYSDKMGSPHVIQKNALAIALHRVVGEEMQRLMIHAIAKSGILRKKEDDSALLENHYSEAENYAEFGMGRSPKAKEYLSKEDTQVKLRK